MSLHGLVAITAITVLGELGDPHRQAHRDQAKKIAAVVKEPGLQPWLAPDPLNATAEDETDLVA